MLVVTSINLPTKLHTIKPTTFLNSKLKDFTLNLNTDYRYLKTAYYVSTHAEVLGNKVIPPSQNIIDTTRTPILLLKAQKAGIPTLPHTVTSSIKQITTEIGFPTLLFAVNPFTYDGYKTAHNRSSLYRAVKSLTMNYKFTVCAQPLKGHMQTITSILGKTEKNDETQNISQKVYQTFQIPICKLHIQKTQKQTYLCGLQPLKPQEITPNIIKTLCEEIHRIPNKGEHPLG